MIPVRMMVIPLANVLILLGGGKGISACLNGDGTFRRKSGFASDKGIDHASNVQSLFVTTIV